MGIALGFEAGMIMLYKIRLRPKVWVMGSGFVVNLGKNRIRVLNKGRRRQ